MHSALSRTNRIYLKYGEALAHSDGGLTTQILWCEKSEMKGTNIFFFCQKFLTDS